MKTPNEIHPLDHVMTICPTDVAELLVALEFITEELRGTANDTHTKLIIAESLKIQKEFRSKYNNHNIEEPKPQFSAMVRLRNKLTANYGM